MNNPIYQQMQANNPMNILGQLKQNPLQFLLNRGLRVPNNIVNDPQKIVQHLLNTGQISQQTYNRAMQMAQNFNM